MKRSITGSMFEISHFIQKNETRHTLAPKKCRASDMNGGTGVQGESRESGVRSRESGAGVGSGESGVRSRESGAGVGSWELGVGSRESTSAVGSRESAVGSRESAVGSRESGAEIGS
ncbi:unnamed protein product [Sphagnum jensenii]|uniref:Uncharacterized protein n=1 Tax=Sphagnum jensenii TaxID=128206 RepID=A0ABP0X3I0_9BRYO